MYVAGIDGGQSSTTAAIADDTGRILGRGSGPPADEVNQGSGSTRMHDAFAAAIAAALADAKLPAQTAFAQIVAGVSGYEGTIYGEPPQLNGPLELMHDAPVAHAGAFAGGEGVIVIAGTGSVAYASDARGAHATVGGWGYVFGDEGSAFWIARNAIARAFADTDDGHPGELTAIVVQYFKVPSLRALARAFYANVIGRDDVAAFAGHIVHTAESGNERAVKMIEDAADALVLLARQAMDRAHMNAPPVAFAGGLLRYQTMRETVEQRMRATMPSIRVVRPAYDPAQGAVLLALARAGRSVQELRT